MATVTLTGNVDTLASGKSWLVEIDFNEQQPNLIQEENDTAFTTTVGNWYFSALNAYWDAGYVVLDWNGLFPDNYMALEGSSVNQWIGRMEIGKRYRFSVKMKSHNEAIDVRYGLRGSSTYMWSDTLPADSTWHTYEQEFTYNHYSGINQPIIYFDTAFDQNNEVWVDDAKIELLDDDLDIVDSDFAVVEFGSWDVGSEDLEPTFVDGIKTSLKIRPISGNMESDWRTTLFEWMEVFNENICRVRFYDNSSEASPILVWRGKIDQKSVSIDLMENWISFDVIDFVIANSDLNCDANPFEFAITDNSALITNYITIEDLIFAYSNYVSQFVSPDTFYDTISSDSNIKGYDLLGRYCTLSGYDNGDGYPAKFSIYSTRYFSSHYASPYGSTIGELLNDMAYAFQVKIVPWLNGTVRMDAVYDTGGTEVTLAEKLFTEVETGIVDMENRGSKLTIIGTRTIMTPTPWQNFSLVDYIPWESTCIDGTGELRKFVDQKTLMFLSDRADTGNSNSLVADLLSQSVSGSVVTQSYFVNNSTYVTPNRFSAQYYDLGNLITTATTTFTELHKTLVAIGCQRKRKFVKCSVTGVAYDPTTIYKLPWDSDRYKVQSLSIDWVNNQTELYLISI